MGSLIFSLYILASHREGFLLKFLLAALILTLAAYPFWRYIREHDQTLPFIPFVAFMYGLYYGLQPLLPFEPHPVFEASEESLIKAQLLVLAGVSLFLISFYGVPLRAWRGLLPQLSQDWSEKRAKRLAIILGAAGLASNTLRAIVYDLPLPIKGLITFSTELSIVAIGVLFVLHLRGRLQWNVKLLLWSLIVVWLLVELGRGGIYPLLRMGIFLAMLYVVIRRTLPWRMILPVVPVFVVLLAVKYEFRNLETDDNPLERGIIFLDLGTKFVTSGDGEAIRAGLEPVSQRTDVSVILAAVVDRTPSVIPYWGGETYKSILTKPIPRFLLPDKPVEGVGQDFGHRYDFINIDDLETTVNTPQLIEMYANFGTFGVIIGMFLLGVLYRGLHFSLNHERQGDWGRVAMAVIFSNTAAAIEGNFSLVHGAILHWVILLYIIGRYTSPSPVQRLHVVHRRGEVMAE